MAQPTEYTRQYNFTNFQTVNPASPLPGGQHDAEYNAIKQTLDQILANLALIQRDDGALGNNTVGIDQLKTEISIGINTVTDWAPGTDYAVNDAAWFEAVLYRCAEAHTSTVFATDLAAERWSVILSLSDQTTAAIGYLNDARDDALEDIDTALTAALASIETQADAVTATAAAVQNIADAAAATYDDFDDRYLGAKSSDPATDNDGDALVMGAMYWNTAVSAMYVYDGAAWGKIVTGAPVVTQYDGDGTDTITLPSNPGSKSNVILVVEGVWQSHHDFDVSGVTLTLASGTFPVGTDNIETIIGVTYSLNVPGDDTVSAGKLQADAVTTAKVLNDAVTNAKLANMAAGTFKMRVSPGTGDPEDGTATEATAALNSMVGDSGSGGTKGLVPAPAAGDAAAAKTLTAAGTWANEHSRYTYQTSDAKTPAGSNQWMNFTGNSVTLAAGKYKLTGSVIAPNSGGASNIFALSAKWAAADGADNSSEPAGIDTSGNVTVLGGAVGPTKWDTGTGTSDRGGINAPELHIQLSASTTVYLAAHVEATTPANVRATASIIAKKIG